MIQQKDGIRGRIRWKTKEFVFLVRNLVLIFGVIDLISAAYHFMLWNRNGRKCRDGDDNSLFSDWKSGERSPVKVSLALMAGIVVLALLIVVQG